MGEIRVVSLTELAAGDAIRTEGMERVEALAAEGVRTLSVRTRAGNVSGWHHHGEHGTYGYVIAGRLRLEFGPGGGRSVEAGPGEFFYVPPATIHREGNPASEDQVVVGFRVGPGPTVFNVDGPE
jgi:uncharacterized RmlC-like cupin family protein